MEEVKFWTKGKIIALSVFLGIIAVIVGIIFLHRYSLKKEYIELQNQFTYAAPNYLLKEQITLEKGQWRKINIKDILSQKLVISDLASSCKGYVLANAKTSSTINYNTYLDCNNIYKTEDYGRTLSSKNENKTKTQSQKDTKKPKITLLGDSTISIELNTKYKEKGAVATDNVDGDITSKIKISGKVDTSKIGEYVLTYSVKDKAKNKSSIKRKVVVKESAVKETKDTTKPTIKFTSDTVQTICTGTKIDISSKGLYGYVAYDDVDGDITSSVKISGATGIVDTVGTYKLEYSVSDKAKNVYTTSRTFQAKDCSSKNTTVVAPTPAPAPAPTPAPAPAPRPSGSNTVTPNTQAPTVTVPVRGIIVTPTSRSIRVGGGFSITATPSNSNASNKSFSFSSSNSSVASVDGSGYVRGISRGSATITVRSVSTPSQSTTVSVIVN